MSFLNIIPPTPCKLIKQRVLSMNSGETVLIYRMNGGKLMPDLDSFMSYELTHDDKKGNYNSGGGCLSGCATVIATVMAIITVVILLVFMYYN